MARKPLPDVETPAAPAVEGAVITRAEQKKLAELRGQMAEVLSAQRLPDEYSFDAFLPIAKVQAQHCAYSALTLGAALFAIRAHEPAARFRLVLQECGIGERSAQSLIALARNSAKSDGHRRVSETLGISKALAVFGRLDDSEIEALAYDEDKLDEMAGKSFRELTAELKKVREELAATKENHERQLQRKNKKIDELDAKLHERRETDPAAQRIGEILVELGASVAEAHKAMSDFERLVSEAYTLENEIGNVLTAAANEQLRSGTQLLASRVAKLQSFRGLK